MMRTQSVVAVLCVFLMLAPVPGMAQSAAQHFTRPVGNLVGHFQWRPEAPANLANSSRLEALIRAGTIYLSLQDTIALALENNLDIELQRYALRSVDADLLRARAGGGTVPSFDPMATFNYNWNHLTTPQTSSFTFGTSSLVNTTRTANFGLSQGFVTGTTVGFAWNNTMASQNSGRSDFNPYTNANFNLQATQHLLQGFGLAMNRRYIVIAKNNLKVSDLAFQQQVVTTVSTVIGQYWDLVSFNEDVKVKRQALALAEKLRSDNQKQVEIGTLAQIEVVRAEAQVASSQQDLTVSETRVLQQETILKNALSRTGVASPTVAEAHVVCTDQIVVPDVEPIQPIQDLISGALTDRPELGQDKLQVENSKIALAGTKSALKPTLDLVGSMQNNGLAGQINTLPIPPVPGATGGTQVRNPNNINPFFLGGYGTVMSQLFARNFPNYAIGFQLNVPLRNRSAQADMIQTQIALRQQEIKEQQLVNQIRVDVTNALIAVQQARVGYQAAVKSRELQEQTLSAEEKKYALGASTVFLVVQSQRDLAQAGSIEVAARSSYTKAKNSLDQATGKILSANGIQIEEAKSGKVSRAPSALPPVGQN
jgi:outer membrane protein